MCPNSASSVYSRSKVTELGCSSYLAFRSVSINSLGVATDQAQLSTLRRLSPEFPPMLQDYRPGPIKTSA
ncbi:hypothetical protein GCM10011575_38490 [Microlunatus endophyticus]|uniref:Uncharacterized protein n=1 Tax=Microlunatus endophyticus TaxID=1716077 RepID=A0A917W6P6_9ACTN|nr:hypothetical protein GCM10011575_38490 [Microlunatus endophyticus]